MEIRQRDQYGGDEGHKHGPLRQALRPHPFFG